MATTVHTRWIAACCALLTTAALAQPSIRPLHTYNGVNRPLLVEVDDDAPTPADKTAEQPAPPADLWIDLVQPDTHTTIATARAGTGTVRLDQLFPQLWRRDADEARLLYAQLRDGPDRIGPALTLQPIVAPATTLPDGRGGVRTIPPTTDNIAYAGIRAWPDQHLRLETTLGVIELRLRPDAAPNTVWHIRELVKGGFYTDVAFHRVIQTNPAGDGFVIQTGDPSGTGLGSAGFFVDLEPSTVEHRFGVASMARRPSDPNTNSSQFFICLSREGTRALDGQYTAFAETVAGADTIARIAALPVRPNNRPLEPGARIIEATLVDAPPRGTGPAPIGSPSDTPVTR